MPNTKSYQKLDSTIQPQRPASSAAIAVAATLRCRFSTVTFITSISVATVVVVFVTVAAAEINTEIAVRKHQIAKKNRAPRDLSADRTTRGKYLGQVVIFYLGILTFFIYAASYIELHNSHSCQILKATRS